MIVSATHDGNLVATAFKSFCMVSSSIRKSSCLKDFEKFNFVLV